jgi:hypothetical protein
MTRPRTSETSSSRACCTWYCASWRCSSCSRAEGAVGVGVGVGVGGVGVDGVAAGTGGMTGRSWTAADTVASESLTCLTAACSSWMVV